ncbi:hypothetical protein ACFY05_06600 [Microtetraspora fusca]|uniref:DUF4132 domain-containing protein n=1 Tax=Microtetraspora fusca TaxID=1997 RepID=A0ABW6UZN4_MICFU
MNVADERWALDHRPSLFDHASRLHERTPDQPLPDGGCPYPDEIADHDRRDDTVSPAENRAALLSTLEAFFTTPDRSVQALHDRISALRMPVWMIRPKVLGDMPWLHQDLTRQAGLWLARHATDRLPAMVGLCLLAGRARPEDIPLVRTLGLLRCFGSTAVNVLEQVPGAADALIWLAERSTGRPRSQAVSAMCRLGDPTTFPWLLRRATDDRGMVGSYARQVAETVSLADTLESGDLDGEITVHAGKLLQALLSSRDYSVQLHEYADACRAIAGFAVQAETAEPALDLLAAVITLAEDLRTGHAACLPWAPGERAATLERLKRLVASPRWTQCLAEARCSPDQMTRWRASWATRAIRDVPPDPVRPGDGELNQLAIHIIVPDPILDEQVETRLLVDGHPVVAEAFRKGGPFGPEYLLGALEATDKSREVRLAEAYCTEGCCGALYVTIIRDGNTVTWRDWRDSMGGTRLAPFHFQAEQYDETVAQAVHDHGWEWTARSLARKLHRLLRDEPDLLATWQCELGGVFARTGEQDTIRMTFWYPHYPTGLDDDDPWLQFEWIIPVEDMDLDAQVIRLADHLRRTDPKTHADLIGGSQEFADHFGFPWPY